MIKYLKVLTLLLLFIYSLITNAQCLVYFNKSPLLKKNHDALTALLKTEKKCPQSIHDFKKLLQKHNLQIKTSMVANRGKNNPDLGSFSFFESIKGELSNGFKINSGDFYLGYFTKSDQNVIKLDQNPKKNKLLIELILWDKQTKLYNFYELRGLNESKTRWYYRGNTKDAFLDNQYLYRNPPHGVPKFGKRMRCSACHNSGGPIMKEIKMPHNDWWSYSNKLPLTPNIPDEDINLLMSYLVDANEFSHDVHAGIKKLNKSKGYKKINQSLSLQEQLRPLFCTTEINIESNVVPGLNSEIIIPSGFWINPLLAQVNITISSQSYQNLLILKKMTFPETKFFDADHAWLTPVKGINDIMAIKNLIKNKVIPKHFAQSVLMIDFSHPMFSAQRCDLLKLIPQKTTNEWINMFIQKLSKKKSKNPNALLLATYLSNSKIYNQSYFDKILHDYKSAISIKSDNDLLNAFNQLLEFRQNVLDNELSKNPLGQILEPGFRLIFPVPM